MPTIRPDLARAEAFCAAYDVRIPILLAPMAGACPPSLSIAVSNAGGLGACGGLLMQPEAIKAWATEVRSHSNGGFQLNLWIPDSPAIRDHAAEAAVRAFMRAWGPDVPPEAADTNLPDFAAQFDAMLEAGPSVISSIMGLYSSDRVAQMKERKIRWFATVTTVQEAVAAEAAGADVVVAQGMEAGGHRGAFEERLAEGTMVGLMSLLPAIADAVRIPVVATGGIGDARGIAAALLLGASAVQIGTGFLRTPEARISPAWADAIGRTRPEDTLLTRAFSGRLGRSVATAYARAASGPDAPSPAPYPVQRALTQPMRDAAAKTGDFQRMQAWAGQSAALARQSSAAALTRELWTATMAMLG